MTKKDHEDFQNSTKYWICDNDYIDNDAKVRGHIHITGKYRGSAHRDCNINVKVNHKIPLVFYNLKNYDSHIITQKIGKINLNRIGQGIDQKEFDLNKYTSKSSKGSVLEVDLEYPKELRELHNDYPLAADKVEIKRETLYDNQLKIADL